MHATSRRLSRFHRNRPSSQFSTQHTWLTWSRIKTKSWHHRWSNRMQWFLEPCGLIRERSAETHQSSFVSYELRFGICQLDSFRRIALSASSSTSSASSSPRYHNPTVLDLLPSVAMHVDTLAAWSWYIYSTRNNSGIVPRMFQTESCRHTSEASERPLVG